MLHRITRSAFLLGLVVAGASSAHGQDAPDRWTTVGSSANGATIAVDSKTLVRDGNHVSAWVRYTWATPQNDGLGKGYTVYLVRDIYDCTARTEESGTWTTSNSRGPVDNGTKILGVPPRDVAPGSVGEMVMETVCSAT